MAISDELSEEERAIMVFLKCYFEHSKQEIVEKAFGATRRLAETGRVTTAIMSKTISLAMSAEAVIYIRYNDRGRVKSDSRAHGLKANRAGGAVTDCGEYGGAHGERRASHHAAHGVVDSLCGAGGGR